MTNQAPIKTPRCPSCGEPAVHAHRPFCSRRCADIDLARWLGGRYVIPGPDLAPGEVSASFEPEGDADDEGERR